MGTMLAGQNIEALWASLDHVDVLSLGLNCATGPEFMTDHVRTLQSLTNRFVSCYPNAGLPNEEGHYQETPTSLAEQLDRFVERGWLNIVGGCCGTTEQHIRAIAQMARGERPAPSGRREPSRGLFRHRNDRSGRKHAAADRRRAHQRDRLARVQEAGRRGTMGRSHGNRAAAGEKRRAHRGRLPAKHRPRRNQGYSALLRPADPQDQSADHDRHHRRAFDRALAHLLPGQEHHQFDQPGRRRGKIRARLPAGAVLRRRADCRLHRRRPAAGAGVHARAQTRNRGALLQAAHGEIRHPRGKYYFRSARVSLRHGR